jgi:NAD(P)-dependent dehydrogenase (short-subunit alcohol dehydrogenase family)
LQFLSFSGRTLEDNDSSAPGSLRHTANEVRKKHIFWENLTKIQLQIESRGGKAIPVACDHNKDAEVDKVFEQIEKEQGRLDILVNNAYSAVDALFNNFGKPFWEIPESIWDNINGVGLRYDLIKPSSIFCILTSLAL